MNEIKEITIYKANKSITFINNGIGFSQFGVADEILDLITNLQEELKSANESITWWQNRFNALQEENKFLKLNNPEMNMEHFRIIKENKRKIDNLREENERLKEDIEILTSDDDNDSVWLEDYNM